MPENKEDEGYLEAVFGLVKEGDFIKARRINTFNLSSMAYIELKREEKDC